MVLARFRRRLKAVADPPSPLVQQALRESSWDPYTPARDAVLAAPREEQVDHVLALAAHADPNSYHAWSLVNDLLRRKLPFTPEQLAVLTERCLRPMHFPANLIGTLERHGSPLPTELVEPVKRLRRKFDPEYADDRKRIDRLSRLLGEVPRGHRWSRDRWMQAMQAAGQLEQLAFAAGATSTPPPKRWQQAAPEHAGDAAVAAIRAALSVSKPQESIPPGTGDVLRGLAFLAALTATDDAARALGDLAIGGYRKIPYHGPLCAKAANAALHALTEMPQGAAQLARARSALRQPAAAEKVEHALRRAADQRGVSREDLEELVLPDFGLGADSVVRVPIGDHVAEMRLLAGQSTELRFVTPSGRRLKSVPKALKEARPDEVAALKTQARDLREMAAAERRRLERLYLEDRTWDYATWRERYLEHGLTGHFARRLIWWFGTEVALGPPDEEPSPDTPVRLWHPAGAETEQVRAWRARLEEDGIQQPFKQAHREVYLLTPAELETETYSNRFAAHVLQQHQLAALCRDRGWRYSLMGNFDSSDEPTLDLPRWDLRVAFWVETPWHDQSDVNDMGIFDHVLTDQVRFTDREGAPVALADVPRLVFTEVMRDVDLFVGVASVGNEPTWHERQNARADQLDYWQTFAFGEMNAQAEIRKDVLERLLPKLRIADVAEIDGRFLRVRGSRRTYKIHLGSGNIQMEPNDQYLCIVSDRVGRGDGRVWLPFEGDRTLALILSKAFLLADDADITDRTILHQIR